MGTLPMLQAPHMASKWSEPWGAAHPVLVIWAVHITQRNNAVINP